jgi:dTDP-glucose 4,6-dehydratase
MPVSPPIAGARAVVTGAAGFIGSHLTDRLLGDGLQVVGLDNFITGDRRNFAHLAGNQAFDFIERDVTAEFDVDGPVDFVFHLASPASPIDYLKIPIETLLAGSAATHRCLDLAARKSAVFLLASTSEVYGDPLVHPQPEGYWGNVNPVGPRSCYDEAKRYAEAATMAYGRERGLETRIVRIFNSYGPRMRLDDGRMVPAFIGQGLRGEPMTVFGDGSQTRSLCYVSDLVEGIWRLARSAVREPVNCGNPHELTVLEFAQAVADELKVELRTEEHPLPEDDPKVRRPDISRARELLDWEPEVSFGDGLRRTIEFFRAQFG